MMEADSFQDSQFVQFFESKWGVTAEKLYEIKFGQINDGFDLDEEYYIVDDEGRKNAAVLMCMRSTLYK